MDGKNCLKMELDTTRDKKLLNLCFNLFLLIAAVCFLNACATQSADLAKNESEPVRLANGATMDTLSPELKKAALVNVELGLGYLAQGEASRAKSKLTHAIKLAPGLPETHSAMAYFREQVGDIKEAEKEYKTAVKLGEGKGAVINNYGAFLCRQKRFKEADLAFQKALLDKNYSRTADVYENAGICAASNADLVVANDYLKTALRQDPRRPTALLELASLNLRQGNFSETKQYLAQYKQVAEPSARSLWLSIQHAHLTRDEDALASLTLIFKNLFENSKEFQEYLRSDIPKS